MRSHAAAPGPDAQDLSLVGITMNWARIVVLPPILLLAGWLIRHRIGQAAAALGFVLALDMIWVAWRCRKSTTRLTIPFVARVREPFTIGTLISSKRAPKWMSAPTGTALLSSELQTQVVYAGWNANGRSESNAGTIGHRGRVYSWQFDLVDYGVLGFRVRTRKCVFAGYPFSVGPQRNLRPAAQPILLPISSGSPHLVDMTVAAAEPVLREWHRGDKTKAIDWRRTERLDEMVVRTDDDHKRRVVVLVDLGDGSLTHEQVEWWASEWAAVADRWLRQAEVTLIWSERAATHRRVVRSPTDVDFVLAGAEPGPLHDAVLASIAAPR